MEEQTLQMCVFTPRYNGSSLSLEVTPMKYFHNEEDLHDLDATFSFRAA